MCAFRKDNNTGSQIIRLPLSTVHDILHKTLKLRAYRIRSVHKITWKCHDSRKQFALEVLPCIEENETCVHTLCFSDQVIFHVCGRVNGQNHRVCNSSLCYWTCTCFTEGQCAERFDEKRSYRAFFFFLKICGERWHFSIYDGEHCFGLFPCGNSSPVIWCYFSLLQSFPYISGTGVF
jgi:hypothetical protein